MFVDCVNTNAALLVLVSLKDSSAMSINDDPVDHDEGCQKSLSVTLTVVSTFLVDHKSNLFWIQLRVQMVEAYF